MSCTDDCRKTIGRQCHCGACHLTFSALSTFDLHRKAGVCVHPSRAVVGGMSERNGVWGQFGSRPAGTWTEGEK